MFKFNPFTSTFDIVELLDIGDAVGSGTSASVLFIDANGKLSQDNANFNYASGVLLIPTIKGSAAASGNLTLQSTSHATKGKILFGISAYDEVNNRLGIGTASPSVALDVNGDIKANNLTIDNGGQIRPSIDSTTALKINQGAKLKP